MNKLTATTIYKTHKQQLLKEIIKMPRFKLSLACWKLFHFRNRITSLNVTQKVFLNFLEIFLQNFRNSVIYQLLSVILWVSFWIMPICLVFYWWISFLRATFCWMSFCWVSFYWLSFCSELFCWIFFCWLLFHFYECHPAYCHSI